MPCTHRAITVHVLTATTIFAKHQPANVAIRQLSKRAAGLAKRRPLDHDVRQTWTWLCSRLAAVTLRVVINGCKRGIETGF